MYKLTKIDKVSLILVMLGSINWGLVGLFNFNLVRLIFGSLVLLERIIYIMVGLSGVNTLLFIKKLKIKFK